MVEIEKPSIICMDSTEDPAYGKYVVQPLERGYGTTLGNSLRRILLTPLMRNISVSVTVPVSGLAVCFAMLAVTKLLVRGKELKDDNDLFV